MDAIEATPFPEELIGKYKTVGEVGPPYQILGPGASGPGKRLARIILVESGEETDYPLEDLISDPAAI